MNAPAIKSLRPSFANGPDFGSTWFHEIELGDDMEWLITGVLPEGCLSALWGDPGSGKSFIALDMAMAVARGARWFDKRVEQGTVAYVAAEGGKGVRKRIVAYRKKFQPDEKLPFVLIPSAVDLCTEDHQTEALIDELARLAAVSTSKLKLVVIDTLNRVMAGGNENDSQDMGALIRNADRIRTATGAHVMFVHHGGKERDRKTRGHSSLFGALDTAIEVTMNETSGLRTAKVRKQKDAEDGQTFTLKLETVELATGRDGAITSCVIAPAENDEPAGSGERRPLSGANAIALDALRRAIEDAGHVPPADGHLPSGIRVVSNEMWRQYFYQLRQSETADANKKAFKRARDALQVNNFVGCWGDNTWIA